MVISVYAPQTRNDYNYESHKVYVGVHTHSKLQTSGGGPNTPYMICHDHESQCLAAAINLRWLMIKCNSAFGKTCNA